MFKKFIFKSVLLLAGLILVLELLTTGSHWMIGQYYRHDENMDYSWLDALTHKPKVMIMGSSTALLALSPKAFIETGSYKPGEVVNVAFHARHPVQSFYIWSHLSPEVRSGIQTVLYGLDPWIFSETYYQWDDFSVSQWSFWQRLNVIFNPTDTFDRKTKTKVLGYGFLQNSIGHSLKNYLTYKPHAVSVSSIPEDFGALTLDGHPKNFTGRGMVRRWFQPADVFPISPYYLDYLKKLKEEVTRDHKEFVFVLTPKMSSMLDSYREDCADLDREFVRMLNAALGPTKIIGNFRYFDQKQQMDLMNDDVHLNRQGQKVFSRYIVEQLKVLDRVKAEAIKPLAEY